VGDVFVRLSTSDNNHRGYDSVGILRNVTSVAVMLRIEAALQRLQTPEGKLVVKRVDIGGAEEAADMDAHLERHRDDWDMQMRHKIYRYLDGRRYSMYFARYLAYLMVMIAEEEQSQLSGKRFKYDWVVHARLDAGWCDAFPPYWKWDMKKMYTPNSWFADVPDTFALTPRHLSDIYFSLDMLIITTIICLGGPNFNPKTATKEYVSKKLGWGEKEYAIVHRELCLTQHPTGFHLIHDKKNNLYWSMSGFSEYFLKRKLANQGVTLNNANIDYYPFFIFIVREPLGSVCFYLDPQYFMPWVKTWQSAAGASAAGCYGMHDGLNRCVPTCLSLSLSIPISLFFSSRPSSSLALACSSSPHNLLTNPNPLSLTHKHTHTHTHTHTQALRAAAHAHLLRRAEGQRRAGPEQRRVQVLTP